MIFKFKHFLVFLFLNYNFFKLKIFLKKKYLFYYFGRYFLKKIINNLFFFFKKIFYGYKIIIINYVNFYNNKYFKLKKNNSQKIFLEIFFIINKISFFLNN